MININEYLINKQTKSLKYDIPELNYDKLNSDDVYKLKDFLKDNDLMRHMMNLFRHRQDFRIPISYQCNILM